MIVYIKTYSPSFYYTLVYFSNWNQFSQSDNISSLITTADDNKSIKNKKNIIDFKQISPYVWNVNVYKFTSGSYALNQTISISYYI